MAATAGDSPEGNGAGAQHRGPGTALSDLVWEERLRTLKDVVASYRLPLVARVKSGDLSRLLPPGDGEESDVIYLHEVRRRKLVLARRLQWETRQNDYIVSGEQLEVPASFKGWFEVVPEDGRPVEYFDTVDAIAGVKPCRFLVRACTVGYQLSVEDGVSCWMPHEIPAGQVLTTGMVYMDNNNNNKRGKGGTTTNTNSKGFFKRLLKSSKSKSRPERDVKYLQCFDADGKEIMIPLIMSGVFSPVGDSAVANYDAVYELQDLIMAFGLPVNVQLIHASLKEKASCPQGVLRLYGSREEELVLMSRLPKGGLLADLVVEKAEVTLDKDLVLQRGMPRHKHSVHSSRPQPLSLAMDKAREGAASTEAQTGGGEVALPRRLPRELSKAKSSGLSKPKSMGLLDKLSVRRVRQERARLKQLRADDVFSKRIVRCDLSYDDFFNGLDGEGEEDTKNRDGAPREGGGGGKAANCSISQSDPACSSAADATCGTGTRSGSCDIQSRDLPPIPTQSPRTPSPCVDTSSKSSHDSLYEHLPPAPHPPQRPHGDAARARREDLAGKEEGEEDEEDGYMVPTSTCDGESPYTPSSRVHMRRKPPAGPGQLRYRKCRSELLVQDAGTADCGSSANVTDLFSFTDEKETHERPYGTMAAVDWTGSTSQLYGYRLKDKRGAGSGDAVAAWHAGLGLQNHGTSLPHESLARTSVDKLNLETRSTQGSRYRSRSQGRNQQLDVNATIRSHNLRKSHGALQELFRFSDSGPDLRDARSLSTSSSHAEHPGALIPETTYRTHTQMTSCHVATKASNMTSVGGRGWDAGDVMTVSGGGARCEAGLSLAPGAPSSTSYMQRLYSYAGYPDSEPVYRRYARALSAVGLSDCAYPKQGDDSAISVGSKASDYTLHNDSEYSYNEYSDSLSGSMAPPRDDAWRPPDDISGLSVQEVARSLRYIGMKDRVALRFANEQIDGSMLCSLDKRLLKEGFPDLNALEIKKILDFVRGWRPKKQ